MEWERTRWWDAWSHDWKIHARIVARGRKYELLVGRTRGLFPVGVYKTLDEAKAAAADWMQECRAKRQTRPDPSLSDRELRELVAEGLMPGVAKRAAVVH